VIPGASGCASIVATAADTLEIRNNTMDAECGLGFPNLPPPSEPPTEEPTTKPTTEPTPLIPTLPPTDAGAPAPSSAANHAWVALAILVGITGSGVAAIGRRRIA
jgi:hypothetical protein